MRFFFDFLLVEDLGFWCVCLIVFYGLFCLGIIVIIGFFEILKYVRRVDLMFCLWGYLFCL